MKFGVQTWFGGRAATPEYLVRVGQSMEQRGFNSIWAAEHVVLFEEYKSQYPYSSKGEFPFDAHSCSFEPFTALTFIAAHTSKIRLGTGICILPQRNPVYTAKQVADLDVLSGGRFDFGIGVGWSEEEFQALDVPFEKRGARAADYMRVMRSLWCDDVSSFKGDYYNLPECVQGPKSVQKPHPPVFFGGESMPALRRVAEFGQGWYGANLRPETLPAHLKRLDVLLKERGRTLDEIYLSIAPFGTRFDLDDVKRFADLGVKQIMLVGFGLTMENMDEVLDDFAERFVVPGKDI